MATSGLRRSGVDYSSLQAEEVKIEHRLDEMRTKSEMFELKTKEQFQEMNQKLHCITSLQSSFVNEKQTLVGISGLVSDMKGQLSRTTLRVEALEQRIIQVLAQQFSRSGPDLNNEDCHEDSSPAAKKAMDSDEDKPKHAKSFAEGVTRVLQHRAEEGKGPLAVSDLAEEFKALWKVPFNLQSAGYTDINAFLSAWPSKVELSGNFVTLAKKADADFGVKAPAAAAPKVAAAAAEPPIIAKKAAPAVAPQSVEPAAPAQAAIPAKAAAATDEPDAKKAKNTDKDTLSRMLVQGVVRVLQSRQKELKGELLLSDLPEEFKSLWKVPFNLQSAGYSDARTFLKAWPNKVEVISHPTGDVVALAKKSAEKAKAEPPQAQLPTAAESVAPAATKSVLAVPAKPASLAPPPKAVAPAVTAPTTSLSPAPPAVSSAVHLDAPIPTTGPEIMKELASTTYEMARVADRQKALVEALNRIA